MGRAVLSPTLPNPLLNKQSLHTSFTNMAPPHAVESIHPADPTPSDLTMQPREDRGGLRPGEPKEGPPAPTKPLPQDRTTPSNTADLIAPNTASSPRLQTIEVTASSPTSPRPALARASTEPGSPGSPASAASPTNALPRLNALPLRPRNRSPYARAHLRSRSTASALAAPSMARAHTAPAAESLPSPGPAPGATPAPGGRPASPLAAAARRASPLRRPLDETSFSGVDIDQTIAEHSELNLAPRPPPPPSTGGAGVYAVAGDLESPGAPLTPSSPYSHSTFPRASVRRRPSSPLHHLLPSPFTPSSAGSAGSAGSHSSSSLTFATTLQHSISTPVLRSVSTPTGTTSGSSGSGGGGGGSGSARYNEAFPAAMAYALSVSTSGGSSVPSTPTSFRSRSPSISSLETIPDSPDAEREAVVAAERDADAARKVRADAPGEGAAGAPRGSFEGSRGRGLVRDGGGATGKERKRWSVCGAERRGDLDLETIWED